MFGIRESSESSEYHKALWKRSGEFGIREQCERNKQESPRPVSKRRIQFQGQKILCATRLEGYSISLSCEELENGDLWLRNTVSKGNRKVSYHSALCRREELGLENPVGKGKRKSQSPSRKASRLIWSLSFLRRNPETILFFTITVMFFIIENMFEQQF